MFAVYNTIMMIMKAEQKELLWWVSPGNNNIANTFSIST